MAVLGVEAHPVRVSQAVCPDLVTPRFADERIAARYSVRRSVVDVDAKDVAEQVGLLVLSVPASISGVPILDVAEPHIIRPAAIAERDVQEIVVAESESAAVVIELRLVFLENHALRCGIGYIGIARHAELRDPRRAVVTGWSAWTERSGIVNEEAAVLLVLRVERQSEQPAFVKARHEGNHPRPDIEERCGEQHAIAGNNPNLPGLIDDEQPARLVISRNDLNRRCESFGHELDIDGERLLDRALKSGSGGSWWPNGHRLVHILAGGSTYQQYADTGSDRETHDSLRADEKRD